MLGPTSSPSESASFPLQVEADEAALSQDVASQRTTRFVILWGRIWTGVGFAVLMLMGVSACVPLPAAPHPSAKPLRHASAFAFIPAAPALGRVGIRPASTGIRPAARPGLPRVAVVRPFGKQRQPNFLPRMSAQAGDNGASQPLPVTVVEDQVDKKGQAEELEYRIDRTDPDLYEYTKEEFIAFHGDTLEWDAAEHYQEELRSQMGLALVDPPAETAPAAEAPAASPAALPAPSPAASRRPRTEPRRGGFSRRGLLQGGLAASMVAFFADGAKLVEGVAGAAGKLSEAGVMLRVSQVAEFDEAFLRQAAGLGEKEAAKQGLKFTWPQLSSSVANLLEVTELEKLPGCARAAEKLKDIKRIADAGKGTLSAGEFKTIADKYALARRELQVAFKALPSELRAAGAVEMQQLLVAEEEILVAEEARLLEMEVAAAASGATVAGASAVVASEAAIANAVEMAEFQATILRQAAELSEGQMANAVKITRPQIAQSANMFLDGLKIDSLPGCRKAAQALKDVRQIAGKGSGSFTKSELSTMADKFAAAQKELVAVSKRATGTELQRMERMALERTMDFRDAAAQSLKKLTGVR